MKRFVILVMTLCLCFSTFATAESLFPSLSTPEPTSVAGGKAPSYGGMANVDPDDVQPYAEGGQVVTYENVDEQGYQDFGVYLNELGYEVVAQNVQGRTAEMKLSDGKLNIGMVYYGEEQKMLLIYEKDVEFEKRDLFAGYTRFNWGDTISLKKFANVSIDQFALEGTLKIENAWMDRIGYGSAGEHYICKTFLFFSLENLTAESIQFYSGSNTRYLFGLSNEMENKTHNGVGIIKLHYINENGEYIYPMDSYGYEWNRYEAILTDDHAMGDNRHYVPSMEKRCLGLNFDVPSNVRNATDGTLAITFDFVTGDKYVLILREDGKKVGEW